MTEIRRPRRRAYSLVLIVAAFMLPEASALKVGDSAPDFTLSDTYGQPVSVKAYRGAVLFLSFGATW